MRFYTAAKSVGNKIYYRGYDTAQGGHFKDCVMYKPTLFMATNKQSNYKTLTGQAVSPIKPGSVKETREFIDNYKDVGGVEVFGMDRFLYQFLAEEFPGEVTYDMDKIKMFSLDIETASEYGFPKPQEAKEEVLLITLKNYRTKKIITFGRKEYKQTRDDVSYILCESEYDLLNSFITWWAEVEPEVITGWNVDYFDMPFLINRMIQILGSRKALTISPWGLFTKKEVIQMGGRVDEKYEITGVTILDYLELYKKFTYVNQESYRLDYIAQVELGEQKLDHSEFETFKEFYTKDWNKFVDYNLVDVDLVDRLEEKMKLIDLVMLMSYDAKCVYVDTYAQVRLWDVIIYNYLRKKNIVLPLTKRSDKKDQYVGAYVKEPKPGGYDWVVSWDLNSLYPSLIRFLNISPETLLSETYDKANVEQLILKQIDINTTDDVAVAANGATYRKDVRGMMPTLVNKMYDERVQYKKQMLQYKQQLVDIESEMKKRGI